MYKNYFKYIDCLSFEKSADEFMYIVLNLTFERLKLSVGFENVPIYQDSC